MEDACRRARARSPSYSFNGATLSTAWKTTIQWVTIATGLCFNGATLSTAWKTMPSRTLPTSKRLQWGHAEHSVEDALAARLPAMAS